MREPDYLRVVRSTDDPPKLQLPPQRRLGPDPNPWLDAPWFAALIVTAMFIGVGFMSMAVGWCRP